MTSKVTNTSNKHNLYMHTNIHRSQDIAVTTLRDGQPRNRGSILGRSKVHTGPSAHPDYYLMGMVGGGGSLPGG